MFFRFAKAHNALLLIHFFHILFYFIFLGPDSRGTDFLIAFSGNYPNKKDLVLFLSSAANVNITAEITYYKKGKPSKGLEVQQVSLLSL